MNTTDILAEAKRRLAEIDAEGEKLRRMIVAAEGVEPVRLVPTTPITYPTQPCYPTPPMGPIWRVPEQPWWDRGITITCGSTLEPQGLRDIRIGDPEPSQFGGTICVTSPSMHLLQADTTSLTYGAS